MNIQNCPPLEARRIFRARPLKNVGIGALIFCAIFSLVFWLNVIVVLVFALVIAGVVYFYLDSRVIFIQCSHATCGKIIDTSTPWLCGSKQCRNENTDEFPFIHECGTCHYVPKAYQCHHCGKLIYLSQDHQQIHAATCLVAPEPVRVKTVVVVKDVIGDKKAMQRDEIDDLEHTLKKTALKKEILIHENRPIAWATPDDEATQLEKDIDKDIARGMSLFKIEEKKYAEAQIKFAHDPSMLAKEREFIERAILKKQAEIMDEEI